MKKSVKEKWLAAILIIGTLGVMAGFVWLLLGSGQRVDWQADDHVSELAKIVLIYMLAVIVMLLHTAVHELGHVIFGKLTGFRFLSYRFMSFGISKKNGKWKRFRMHVPGTAGQALMEPPVVKDGERKPYFWYNAGGILMNVAVSAVSMLVCYVTASYMLFLVCVMSSTFGMFFALTNAIPFSKKGISDGCNILQFYKYPSRIDDFYMQLSVLGELSRGKTWKEFDLKQFQTEEVPDNAFSMIPMLYQVNYYNANLEFGKARKVLQVLDAHKDDVAPVYGNIISLELMFQELIGENDPMKVELLYTNKLRKFVKTMKFETSVWRCQMAYEWFHNQDEVAALICYEKIKKLREKAVYPGDAEMDWMLAEYIKKRMEQTDVLQWDENQV